MFPSNLLRVYSAQFQWKSLGGAEKKKKSLPYNAINYIKFQLW